MQIQSRVQLQYFYFIWADCLLHSYEYNYNISTLFGLLASYTRTITIFTLCTLFGLFASSTYILIYLRYFTLHTGAITIRTLQAQDTTGPIYCINLLVTAPQSINLLLLSAHFALCASEIKGGAKSTSCRSESSNISLVVLEKKTFCSTAIIFCKS